MGPGVAGALRLGQSVACMRGCVRWVPVGGPFVELSPARHSELGRDPASSDVWLQHAGEPFGS